MEDLKKKVKNFLKKYGALLLFIFGTGILVLNAMLINAFQGEDVEKISYNEFLAALDRGDVDTIYYNPGSEWMTVTFYNEVTRDLPDEEREAYEYSSWEKKQVPYPAYDEFRKDMVLAGAHLSIVQKYDVLVVAGNIVSMMFPLMFLGVLMGTMKGQIKGITEKDIIHSSEVRFSDVIGQDEIIDDLKFITALIKDPKKGDKVGAKPPKGLLLQGPPGTGKTLIAKAIAGEAGVPFLQQSASGFIEMYVGLGAKRVRDLFKVAKRHAPCIIFIDEIDAVGGDRDKAKNTSEHEQTINALLEQMDGFSGQDGVFVIAATNRADKLDPALVRPGRFDRQVTVNPPRDWMVRQDLFKHYLGKFSVSDDVDIEGLSKQVSGFTGADIAVVCNEASIVAMMKDKPAIDMACIEEAIDKKVFKGNRSKRKQFEQDRQIVAYHESGHAVMSWLMGEPISRASILSTVSGVGGVVFNADKETLFSTDRDFRNRMMVLYAGRASEEIKFGDVTTGASNDITQATNLMLQYIEHLGFDSSFGLLDIGILGQEHLVDSKAVTERLTRMSTETYEKCRNLLNIQYEKVELLATQLLEKETLSGDAIMAMLGEPPIVT